MSRIGGGFAQDQISKGSKAGAPPFRSFGGHAGSGFRIEDECSENYSSRRFRLSVKSTR